MVMDEIAADEEENQWGDSGRVRGARDAAELKCGGEFELDGGGGDDTNQSQWTPESATTVVEMG